MLRVILLSIALLIYQTPAKSQGIYPPGTFSIDGIPIVCGPVTFVVTTNIPDVGIANGQGQIFLNPIPMSSLPTVMKLFWAAHECGHYAVGSNESAADCWAVKTGRKQGWFPAAAFSQLMIMFQNNPGDQLHPSGPARVSNMFQCYNTP